MSTQPGDPHTADPHTAHDRMLISAAVAGDLAGSELARAAGRIADCPECAALAADLRSIAAATRILPPPSRASSRDFRLSPALAADLQRATGWRRLLRAAAGSQPASLRLAGTLATLGVAGLLLATLPAISLSLGVGGSSESRAVDQAAPTSGQGGLAPSGGNGSSPGAYDLATDSPKGGASLGPVPALATSGPAATAGSGDNITSAGGASPPSATDGRGGAGPIAGAATPPLGPQYLQAGEKTASPAPLIPLTATARAALFTLSMLLLVAGVCLFALRRASARRT